MYHGCQCCKLQPNRFQKEQKFKTVILLSANCMSLFFSFFLILYFLHPHQGGFHQGFHSAKNPKIPQRVSFLPLFCHVLIIATLSLSGCPQYLLNKLQKVLNKAALLVTRVPKTDHISPYLAPLHWSPIDLWIQYKLSSHCYDCLNLTAPDYLTEHLRIYKPTHQLQSSCETSIPCLPPVCTHSLGHKLHHLPGTFSLAKSGHLTHSYP